MPIPLLLGAALVSAGASVANNVIGGMNTAAANRASMAFQEHMYDRQRADALADWNRNNEYNSPIAQMARLKSAGLNPALFYGGGSGAIQTAQPIRSSSPGSYRAEAFKPDFSTIVNGAMDILLKREQVRNLQANNDLIHAQADEVKSRIPKNEAETKTTEFDLQLKQKLESVNIAIRNGDYAKLMAETENIYKNMDLAQQRNAREIAMQNIDIKEKVAQTAKIIAETKNIEISKEEIMLRIVNAGWDSRLKQLELNARGQGWTWHDNIMMRMLGMLADKLLSTEK